MEPNSENIFLSSSGSMEDDIFQAATPIIEGTDYSASPNFPGYEREDLVITDSLWNDEYVDPWLLPQQSRIPPPLDELCSQAMEIPQISSSSLQSNDPPHAHLFSTSQIKQQRRSYWEVDEGVVEEADAFTRKISERKRRGKLKQLFIDLHSILPHNSNSKQDDKISILSNAVVELNQNKLRIGELQQQNEKLTNAISHNESETSTSLSHGYTTYIGRNELIPFDCEEVVVLIEEGSIPVQVIVKIKLKKSSTCTHMDAVVTLLKCLRDIKLEVEVVKIESREIDATKQAIEVTVRFKIEGERLDITQGKVFEETVKHAFSLI